MHAEEEEDEYIKQKFNQIVELVDKDTMLIISKTQITASAIKIYYGLNYCRERDKRDNKGVLSDEFLRCSEKETWHYVVQCRHTASMRAEFVLEFHKYLKKG